MLVSDCTTAVFIMARHWQYGALCQVRNKNRHRAHQMAVLSYIIILTSTSRDCFTGHWEFCCTGWLCTTVDKAKKRRNDVARWSIENGADSQYPSRCFTCHCLFTFCFFPGVMSRVLGLSVTKRKNLFFPDLTPWPSWQKKWLCSRRPALIC